jgi:tRNA threonylcarbamoyladenosine biosynthesis protein TsaE
VAAVTERFAAIRTTRSARATTALGVRLGRLLRPGDVVALVGELGTGKTQLVRGACEGAGVAAGEVSSPSFAIVATYRGHIPVHHADLYRIGDEDELYGTGFGDLVGGEGALLVEWADLVPGALPAERLELRLAHDARAPDVRRIAIEGTGARAAALARALAAPSRRRASPAVSAAGRPARTSRPSSRASSSPRSRSSRPARGARAGSRKPRRR